ncbi:MAG TPA: ATPase [Candidatus Omnitrophica bacterium]|nr:MAG: hypothetical protein A2Z81_08705 [Omnitrophica WOR_2 bacterium GWA2_45_18]OGX19205.1 MAG: hypothetical protein A2Y04_00090 [Omnitrophica WOR_2 bacterium GWC2_45_7]HBR15675.1 ATPase [Candidatus Omnitrophota bacterium]
MRKDEILQILQPWNLWQGEPIRGVVRPAYFTRLKQFLRDNQVVTITGPRRSGKSYIMRQVMADLVNHGVPPANILMVNFEDSRFENLDVQSLDQIHETYLEFHAPKGEKYIFLDEVHLVPKWEKWVRRVHELKLAKVVVSGSNTELLSREFGTVLTGRHLDLKVLPLSFSEYMAFNNYVVQSRGNSVLDTVTIKGYLRKYLEHGSFPEVVLSESKKEILLNYFDDILYKDVIRRFKIRKEEGLKALFKYYLSNPSSHVTFTSLAKFLNLSHDSIERFSGYLEQVFAASFVKYFSYKVGEQEKNARKVYAYDTGLCNAVGFRFSDNWGKLAENVVFLELKRRQQNTPQMEIYYWKCDRDKEVDFAVKDGLSVVELIQVCWDVSALKTRERETKNLLKAMAQFDLKEGLIITDDEETELKSGDCFVRFVPLWKWLLREEGVLGPS